MKCPNCNAAIPEGKMYCENCGAELQIVPDIDLDLDIQAEMENTLNNIAETEFYDDDIDFDDDPNLLSMILSGHAGGKLFYAVFAVVLVLVLIAAVTFMRKVSKQNSLEYQIEQVDAAIADNNLIEAISHLESAYKLDGNTKHLFDIADYYYTLGRDNDAIYTLTDIASNTSSKESEVLEAYAKIISLYEKSENYTAIASLLDDCTNEVILSQYAAYRAEAPVFNYEAGTYKEKVILKLSAEGNGKIYYSMDAKTPDSGSDVFESPIFLEYGSYTVSAVYINNYGVSSEVVSNKYLIDVDFVFEPTILTETGEYDKATQIEAEVPVMYQLYYTTDGTEPDKNSIKYSGPIAMPLGDSEYKFICYASDGTQSTVVTRYYSLNINTAITEENSIPWLKNLLVSKGLLSDAEGHKEGVAGYYIYAFTTAYNVEGAGDYFFIVEYYIDEYGNTKKTNTIYAMNVYNANDVKRVQSAGSGTFTLSDF